jgi:hypothetical protein
MIRNQHHAETLLALHHIGMSFCGTFERSCFDHRTNVFENTKRQGILDVDGGTIQASLLLLAIIISAYPPSTPIPEIVTL